MGLDALPKLGYQPPTVQNSVRTMSDEEIRQARKEQEAARRAAELRKPDNGAFFLEYFRYRDRKVSQSPVKMAQVMAKTKADDLSKTGAGQQEGKEEKDAVEAVAQELGVSVEQLTIAVGGDEALSDVIKEMSRNMSQKGIAEKHLRRLTGGPDLEPESEKSRAAAIRKRAAELEHAAAALNEGGVTTGVVPGARALKSQAELCRQLAGLVDVLTGA